MNDVIAVLQQALTWRNSGRKVALATVVKTWGSSPRQVGSMMCVDDQQGICGSVSGGCVESAVIAQMRLCLRDHGSKLLNYGVTNEKAWELGLPCGGSIEVFAHSLDDDDFEQISLLIDYFANDREALILLQEDAPRLCVLSDSEFDNELFSAKEQVFINLALVKSKPLRLDGERFRFVCPFQPQIKVYIVGGVDLSQKLTALMQGMGYKICVVDPRRVFVSADRFSDVELICSWPKDYFEQIELDRYCAVIALSHDPRFDDQALAAALHSEAFYIGALGSRKSHAARLERLLAMGFSDQQLARIDAPVGLDINASTPQEIAVSILAAVVAKYRQAHV